MKENRHGTYDTIRSEKEVLSITTSTKCCVVHFAHKDFRRCQLMDKHLSALAPKFFRTRFVRIDVDDAPFLVERLKIKVLPCVVPFIDGVSVDRLVGFEAVGNSDNVPTSAIEKWLLQTKAIEEDRPSTKKSIFGYPAKSSSDDEDSDY
ncbi:thioredoxin-like protein [Gaertneriomyces semiglobifer]|nr:thioredoxin-like protein [Gaertneriomyces semiglobifer]